MSQRYYQKFYVRCGSCRAVQRLARGYRPIANPILFDSDVQCRNFHDEKRVAAGFVGMTVTCRCEACCKVHSDWTVLDAQRFLDVKLAMSPAERARLLWPAASPDKTQAQTSATEATATTTTTTVSPHIDA